MFPLWCCTHLYQLKQFLYTYISTSIQPCISVQFQALYESVYNFLVTTDQFYSTLQLYWNLISILTTKTRVISAIENICRRREGERERNQINQTHLKNRFSFSQTKCINQTISFVLYTGWSVIVLRYTEILTWRTHKI